MSSASYDCAANAEVHLDLRGLSCPMPILRTRKALTTMSPGATVWVEATDPHAVPDFESYCEKTGIELVQHWEAEGVYHFLLRVPPTAG